MNRIALVCVDIDGTLVGSRGRVHEAVWQAASAARDSGIRIAICSGRPALGLALRYAAQLDADGWHSFQNGGSIVHPESGASRSVSLPPAVVPALIARARHSGRVLELYSDTDYTVESTNRRAVEHAALLDVPFRPRALELHRGTVVRAQWVVAHEQVDTVLADPHFGLEVSAATSPAMPDTSFIGLTPAGVNKGVAVRAIAAEYGVPLDQVMFVGDGGNDLAAMQLVGCAVATRNAEPAVRAVAHHVVGDVDAGGAAEAFRMAAAMAIRPYFAMTLYDIAVTTIDGTPDSMDSYRGKTLLVVNVASRCGMTPQYAGLEALWRKYRDDGLVVLGFPCDGFGHQEPGSEADIASFCSLTYDVTFPMFSKIDVNGPNTHPLYAFLKSAQPGVLGTEAIKWNFTKFLVDAGGTVRARYAPNEAPESFESEIAALLESGAAQRDA